LRAPVFLGLRPDIEPEECVRETTAPLEEKSTPGVRPPLLSGKAEEAMLTVDGQRLKFTHLNKIFYPAEGYTKRDLLNYYDAAADLLLPYLRDRPLSLKRYPDGIAGEFFFQKDTHDRVPSWIRVEPIYSEHKKAPTRFVLADDRAALLYLTNLGCIDQNPWMSRVGALECPDFMLIDLDPQGCEFDRIIEAAQLVRKKLDLVGLEGYPKTTGGDGMHIYVPVEPVYSYEQVRSFAEIVARVVATERPDLFTTPRPVARREQGKVYFDYLQIGESKTIAAPYVVRAYPGAPVATPLAWREVAAGLLPSQFHLRNALDRFSRVGDLFEPVLKKPQRLEPAIEKLDKIVKRDR
jgi:bifunctional non-homologous end joining protein LigD